MASATVEIDAFAQSIYLIIKNRYYDDLTSEDGKAFVAQVIDFTNQYLDELENEVDSAGAPINWNWVRQFGVELGTAVLGQNAIPMPTTANNLLTDEGRYVNIVDATGAIVSQWSVAAPSDISDINGRTLPDKCAVVGSNIVFSRNFTDKENAGTIVGDIATSLPRLSATNTKILSLVKPKQLLILGVAKNATLPDIVKGVLSPSYVQKYGDLLKNAIARNEASSLATVLQRDDFSSVGGVGF